MKIRQSLIKFTFAILSIALLACSNDNNHEVTLECIPTNVSMTVNGDVQTFQAIGRGIDITENGYILSINLDRRNFGSTNEQGVYLELPYKRTGKNLIKNFIYHQYINNVPFDGNFVTDGNFQSEVLINRETCFSATFSGTLKIGAQEIVITKGVLNYTYETPFTN